MRKKNKRQEGQNESTRTWQMVCHAPPPRHGPRSRLRPFPSASRGRRMRHRRRTAHKDTGHHTSSGHLRSRYRPNQLPTRFPVSAPGAGAFKKKASHVTPTPVPDPTAPRARSHPTLLFASAALPVYLYPAPPPRSESRRPAALLRHGAVSARGHLSSSSLPFFFIQVC
jgi:hypothetical protein